MAFEHLKTLAEVNAERRAVPKHELQTRMDRAIEKKKADAKDAKALAVWARKVKQRDAWTDRYTGKLVNREGPVLHPDAAHAHHIVSRDDARVRTDVRNGITLSALTHFRVEHNQLRIKGTKFFRIGSTRYIDATYEVRFVPCTK